MDSSSIRLPGSELSEISFADGRLRVRFAHAYIIKTMTGSAEKTLWWQAGELVLDEAQLLEPLPVQEPGQSLVCDGGDIDENVYTYRDMIPIPLESRGHCACDLKLQGSDARIKAQGASVRLQMTATPKYIEHIRPEDGEA